MASIVKRRKKYSVVYRYTDDKGNDRQKWETFNTIADAKKRKARIEYEMENDTFIVPTARTLKDLLEEYLSTYGVNTWAMSTYDSNCALLRNYVLPILGDMKLSDITPRVMDQYYRKMLSVRAVVANNRQPKSEYVTPKTVRSIHKILRTAFNQAVKWELIERNPVLNATLPKCEKQERAIWEEKDLIKAMDVCEDDDLSLAINLAFSCSLRLGEMLGLTWDCVDISEESIHEGRASIYINKVLQRCTRDSLNVLDEKGVIFKFPPLIRSTHTALVLKEPKTKTSIRRVYLPKTVAEMLVRRKKDQEELKELIGDEYTEYNLVFTYTNGRPMENAKIERDFSKLIRDNNLPKVVFHSLRHSSITYKLKLNGGDMKAVQGDSGHAQMSMITDVYSHILDEDRTRNAELIEAEFYSGRKKEELENEKGMVVKEAPETTEETDDMATLMKLLQKPEMAAMLKTLAKAM